MQSAPQFDDLIRSLASAGPQLTAMQLQHLSGLKGLWDRMEAETNKARSELEDWEARPWRRRLAE
ncbi:hypothetical protein J4G37_33455 [Microvirga sp. 3-52]|nr:hypothetical protein [Microvirga sp. 3-52]